MDYLYIHECTAPCIVFCLIAGMLLIPAGAGATTWNVSPVAGGEYANVTSLLAVPALSDGDTIRIWGVDGYTCEGGITIDRPDVLVTRWDGSPERPLITNTSHTAPAITVTADNVTLRGLDISHNRLNNEDGAGVCVAGPSWDNHLQGFTVTDCVFTGNAVTGWTPETGMAGSGGAIGCRHVDTVVITDTTCADNTAEGFGGGALFYDSDHAAVTNTTFTNNTAQRDGGGACFDRSNYATVTNTTFADNTAQRDGGGACFDISQYATVTNTTFADNTAKFEGGGAYFGNSLDCTVTNCLFENDKNLYTIASHGMTLSEPNLIKSVNIIGGPYRGGNVWLRDPAQNISEWGSDADFDGICDQSLNVGDGTDFFPLVYGGTVTVTSTPQDAYLYVDGVNTTRMTDTSLYLPVGEHLMTVALRGYVTPANKTVTITAGNTTTLDFDLVRETGFLEVTSVPEGAAIILDGVDTHTLTNAKLADPLPTGEYTVTIALDGYVTPTEETVTVTTGNTTTISFAPAPAPTPAPHSSGGKHSTLSAGAADGISAGDTVSFAVQHSAFNEIGITAGNDIPKILITIGKTTLPFGTDAPPIEIYEYDEVLIYHTTDDMIAGATLDFSVSKAWLTGKGFVPGDVVLYRLHDGEWQKLTIHLTGEDAGSYFFTARTPGLSIFAIGAEHGSDVTGTPTPVPASADPAPTADDIATTAPAEAVPTATQSPVPYGVAVLAAGLVYFLEKRHK